MSENQNEHENENQQVGDVGPAELPASSEPIDSVEPVTPAKKPVRRGRIATVAGSVALALAVVAGVGWTAVTVDGADRDAGDPVWEFPKAGADEAKAAPATGLSAMLVPYDAGGWSRGPDIGEYGNDVQLDGDQATALRKESLNGLPRSRRKALEKQIDKQRLTGIAMRSYLSTDELAPVYTDEASAVTIQLMQLDNKAAARGIAEFQNEFFDAFDSALRDGPRIEGHKDARCFLLPNDADVKLDTMYCSALQGNVLVSLTADSGKPMRQKGIAMLMGKQLDRIAEPGESV
ncbi:hypothetical protein [Streptomyces sp. NPDC005374]|uniref:hypothetical protein n=1 Tax=Streptomyces sp. NPDC005374 TaxID=3364713 RepID=UPI0036A06ADD